MVVQGKHSFAEALQAGGLVADGAMGTQLYERGVLFSACFEDLNLGRPELVRRVHEDYVRAGATVIETNTFGANALRLEKHGISAKVRDINVAAVKIAREATEGRAWVVGAIGPSGYFLGEASQEDLARVREALYEQACALLEAGVDGILVETMRQATELRVAMEAAVKASGGKVQVEHYLVSAGQRRLMIDRFGGHRANQCDVVGDAARVGQQLRQFHSALSVLTSIRTVSAKSDNSDKAAHLGCVRNEREWSHPVLRRSKLHIAGIIVTLG